ncbi:LysR family transcriptional regulator [Paraburkholderia terrae]|uniref:LysR family transcriptional regulator n=1 Tax=Paraburkholderia terrae TaxID=311230 RepID=UPI001EE26EB1|nr:LysR family transcriptional regulator [Paraburkholderia terrae]GJH00638.1 LysR family transcriptional regulator [Paraburkholderia terrae]
MSDRFQELHVFARAAETGSFSATARELGLSQPSVSRIVSELEARLGTTLLLRSTRNIVPTEAGKAFLLRARKLLRELEEADDEARHVGGLSGVLRVATSAIVGVRTLIPSMPVFLKAHPALRIELLTSDSMQDLIAEGADLAVRFGELEDSGFGARKIGMVPRMLVASPAYLRERGIPATLDELAAHDIVTGPSGPSRETWTFEHDGVPVSIKVHARVFVGAAEGVIACVREGLGIAMAKQWLCEPELQSGQLVTVLDDYRLPSAPIHAVFPEGAQPSQKVRLFTDHLIEVFSALHGDTRFAPYRKFAVERTS